MKDSIVWCQLHIRICGGNITFTKLLVSILDSIYIKYVTKIPIALSTDTIIHVESMRATLVSVQNHI